LLFPCELLANSCMERTLSCGHNDTGDWVLLHDMFTFTCLHSHSTACYITFLNFIHCIHHDILFLTLQCHLWLQVLWNFSFFYCFQTRTCCLVFYCLIQPITCSYSQPISPLSPANHMQLFTAYCPLYLSQSHAVIHSLLAHCLQPITCSYSQLISPLSPANHMQLFTAYSPLCLSLWFAHRLVRILFLQFVTLHVFCSYPVIQCLVYSDLRLLITCCWSFHWTATASL